MPAVLDDIVGPDLPLYTEDAWRAFVALSSTRTLSMAGANPIAYTELEAYQRVERHKLTPMEIACIRAADRCVMRVQGERMNDTAANNTLDEINEQEP